MLRAHVALRHTESYRHDLFESGLKRLGYSIASKPVPDPDPGDVLVIWNRSRSMEDTAVRYEQAGARVIVTENGYLPRGGEKQFALALSKHNGAGEWYPENEARWTYPLKPWRETGSKIVILMQRGIGSVGVAQPHGFRVSIADRLRRMTGREIIMRRHPGRNGPALEPTLKDAWCVVTWGSAAALKAIVNGVPAFYGFPKWIGREAACPVESRDIENPFTGDRGEMIRWISWAQWSASEIESGQAFAHLLRRT